jgi:hypothetical protein
MGPCLGREWSKTQRHRGHWLLNITGDLTGLEETITSPCAWVYSEYQDLIIVMRVRLVKLRSWQWDNGEAAYLSETKINTIRCRFTSIIPARIDVISRISALAPRFIDDNGWGCPKCAYTTGASTAGPVVEPDDSDGSRMVRSAWPPVLLWPSWWSRSGWCW